MVDPFRHKPPGLVERGFRVMDAVEGRAGAKRLGVGVPAMAQFAVGGDDGAFAAPANGDLSDHGANPLIANGSQNEA